MYIEGYKLIRGWYHRILTNGPYSVELKKLDENTISLRVKYKSGDNFHIMTYDGMNMNNNSFQSIVKVSEITMKMTITYLDETPPEIVKVIYNVILKTQND